MSHGRITADIARSVAADCTLNTISMIGEKGRFLYAHKQFNKTQELSGYNLLRHSGTVWFSCKSVTKLGLDLNEIQTRKLKSAVRYILKKIKQPSWLDSSLDGHCLTSKNVVKLGGTGLALLMIREFHRMNSATVFSVAKKKIRNLQEYMERLENYLISQIDVNDFVHKRAFSDGKISSFRSDYYTGEALFPLMSSKRQFPAVRTALDSLLFSDYGIPQQSHWMAYAACSGLANRYTDQIRICIYLERLIRSILDDSNYRTRHESTPIAVRSEALVEFLLTCLRIPAASVYFSENLQNEARQALEENLILQLEYYGDGQFRKGKENSKVQIDYIQHNGAAFLGWWELLQEEAKKL